MIAIYYTCSYSIRRTLSSALIDAGNCNHATLLINQHILKEERRKAERARSNAIHQASMDAKRASDEVQASGGEVAEKKPKVVYRH